MVLGEFKDTAFIAHFISDIMTSGPCQIIGALGPGGRGPLV